MDRKTRDLVSNPPQEILEQCRALWESALVEPELLRSRIEVDTRVCAFDSHGEYRHQVELMVKAG